MLIFRGERSPSTPTVRLQSKMDFKLVFFLFSTIFSLSAAAFAADLAQDKRALLDFLSNIHHSRDLNWRNDTLVCSTWTGITCNHDNSRVVAVRLPAIGINGRFPPNTLGRLSALRILSLRSNGFTGPFPSDLLNITGLTGLHLQLNSFSGNLPPSFSGCKYLTVLDLSFNNFTGSIPASISNLTNLAALNLSNNSLSGEIPDLELPNLQFLNLSNNHLNGSIPRSLLRFPNSSFSGNDFVPVLPVNPPPLLPSIPSSPSTSSSPPIRKHSRRLTESEILAIAVGGFALVFIALAILMLVVYSGRRREGVVSGKASKGGDRSPEKAVSGNQDENNRLVFFEGCNFAFDLEDLLRASAEVLGKGTFGTAYRAVLEDATTVVVKRLKEVGVGKKEFEQQMEVVGRIKHENVMELRAYYYSKDEKLTVYDYYSQGSVSSLLHGMMLHFTLL